MTSYSDEKEVVGLETFSSRPYTASSTAFSDKQVAASPEKILKPDLAFDAPQIDQRAQSGLEVASSPSSRSESPNKQPPTTTGWRRHLSRKRMIILSIIATLIAAAIIAAAVATTVGQPHGQREESSPASSAVNATSATTSTSPTATSASDIGNYTCPESNGTLYNTSYFNTANYGSFYFLQLCDTDWPAGAATPSPNETVKDLSIVLADSLEQCMNQCALYSVENDLACMAVTYGANKTLAVMRDGVGGNCRLKNSKATEDVADGSGQLQAAYVTMMTG